MYIWHLRSGIDRTEKWMYERKRWYSTALQYIKEIIFFCWQGRIRGNRACSGKLEQNWNEIELETLHQTKLNNEVGFGLDHVSNNNISYLKFYSPGSETRFLVRANRENKFWGGLGRRGGCGGYIVFVDLKFSCFFLFLKNMFSEDFYHALQVSIF